MDVMVSVAYPGRLAGAMGAVSVCGGVGAVFFFLVFAGVVARTKQHVRVGIRGGVVVYVVRVCDVMCPRCWCGVIAQVRKGKRWR